MLKTACGSPCYAAPELIKGLEYIGIKSELIQELQIKFSGYVKLNPSGSNKGKFNTKWGVRINI
jgi:predicted transcriptional regulator of viral defense system